MTLWPELPFLSLRLFLKLLHFNVTCLKKNMFSITALKPLVVLLSSYVHFVRSLLRSFIITSSIFVLNSFMCQTMVAWLSFLLPWCKRTIFKFIECKKKKKEKGKGDETEVFVVENVFVPMKWLRMHFSFILTVVLYISLFWGGRKNFHYRFWIVILWKPGTATGWKNMFMHNSFFHCNTEITFLTFTFWIFNFSR